MKLNPPHERSLSGLLWRRNLGLQSAVTIYNYLSFEFSGTLSDCRKNMKVIWKTEIDWSQTIQYPKIAYICSVLCWGLFKFLRIKNSTYLLGFYFVISAPTLYFGTPNKGPSRSNFSSIYTLADKLSSNVSNSELGIFVWFSNWQRESSKSYNILRRKTKKTTFWFIRKSCQSSMRKAFDSENSQTIKCYTTGSCRKYLNFKGLRLLIF